MNLQAQPDLTYATQRGWISIRPEPSEPAPRQVQIREAQRRLRLRRYRIGLTATGTIRQRRLTIPKAIVRQAARDGVGVTAIYNRIKRTGTMRPSNHPNSKGVCHV